MPGLRGRGEEDGERIFFFSQVVELGAHLFFPLFFSFFLILKSVPLWAERGGLCEWPIIMGKRMKVTVVVEGGKICVTKVCWCWTRCSESEVQTPKVMHLREAVKNYSADFFR